MGTIWPGVVLLLRPLVIGPLCFQEWPCDQELDSEGRDRGIPRACWLARLAIAVIWVGPRDAASMNKVGKELRINLRPPHAHMHTHTN